MYSCYSALLLEPTYCNRKGLAGKFVDDLFSDLISTTSREHTAKDCTHAEPSSTPNGGAEHLLVMQHETSPRQKASPRQSGSE